MRRILQLIIIAVMILPAPSLAGPGVPAYELGANRSALDMTGFDLYSFDKSDGSSAYQNSEFKLEIEGLLLTGELMLTFQDDRLEGILFNSPDCPWDDYIKLFGVILSKNSEDPSELEQASVLSTTIQIFEQLPPIKGLKDPKSKLRRVRRGYINIAYLTESSPGKPAKILRLYYFNYPTT